MASVSPDPPDLLPGATGAAPAEALWTLRLLGTVEARRGAERITRWPSRAAAALLARLALAPQRSHPREELVELLWPGVALDVGRNRLRQVLSTLRSLLEGDDEDSRLIDADRHSIRLRPERLHCDVADFERQVRAGDWAAARRSYGGELMPGHYDDWVLEARAHLAALFDRVEAQAAVAPPPLPPPPATPAAPTSWADPPLPASWTRVFGIEHSAARLLALLRHERLVTVVGPGGCGKTRLALEVARALRQTASLPPWPPGSTAVADAPARVIFVSLVECGDEAQALAALALALHVSGREPLQQIQAKLADAPALLVLDNFEQLVGRAQGLLLRLLEAAPGLRLLVTSRLRLNLAGEQVFVLRGLPLPDDGTPADTDATLLNPAVALFVDRARAVRADFHPSAAELPALCALVRWLAGMPLALELAASRVASFAPAQMLELLRQADGGGDGLDLLARRGPRAGHDPRHASMSEVIRWSWRLLQPAEQRLLAALSVFAGDAGVTGVAAVLGHQAAGQGRDHGMAGAAGMAGIAGVTSVTSVASVAAGLDDLAGQSMLQTLAGADGEPRFALLEPVREFVRSRWPAPELQALQQGLLRWLLQWARSLGRSPKAAAVAAEMRSVLSLLQQPAADAESRIELALALRATWDSEGLPLAQQTALEQALVQWPDAPPLLASDLHEMLAYLRFEAGFLPAAREHAEAALQAAGSDAGRRARALTRRAWVELAACRSDDDSSPQTDGLQADLQQALSLAEAAGDREAQARALHQLAVVTSQMRDDWAAAEALLARSQALWTELGDRRKAAARLRNRGQCWTRLGRGDEALACFEQCEQQARADGDWLGQIDSLLSLSTLRAERRQWAAALALDRTCVALCWQRWHRHGLAYALWNPPLALARLRRPEAALRLMAFAARFWEQNFGPLGRADRRTLRRVRRLAQAQLGAARAQGLWDEGLGLDVDRAVALALQV
ncbi:MAG: AAA family ATPase [Proteobacteria bacterium]|nr:AAA family ATPase [Pseudomonadota bacterium]